MSLVFSKYSNDLTRLCHSVLAFKITIPFIVVGLSISGCVAPKSKKIANSKTVVTKTEHINNETKFSAKEFGVAGSPRITSAKRTRKGGGRFQVGKPYKIRGKWYTPKEDANLKQVGLASWYGPNFHGRLTANGEIYDQYGISAAHPTMPLPSYAFVTNLENGRKIKVRVNDRGPYAHGRVIDLSARAAELLGYTKQGVAKVKVEYAGRARMDGLDEKILLASYRGPSSPALEGTGDSGTGTMIAMVKPRINTNAASAINQTFQPTATALSAGIPTPAQRPALFEGVPLAGNANDGSLTNQIERVVYRPVETNSTTVLGRVPRPLAYAYDVSDQVQYAYFYEEPDVLTNTDYQDREIRISIGKLQNNDAVNFLRILTVNAGSVQTVSNVATLVTTEKHANKVLEYLRDIGFSASQIQ